MWKPRLPGERLGFSECELQEMPMRHSRLPEFSEDGGLRPADLRDKLATRPEATTGKCQTGRGILVGFVSSFHFSSLFLVVVHLVKFSGKKM